VIELQDYTMRIYVQDRRTKSGERILNTYTYPQKHEQWMREEVRDLQAGLYPAPKFRIEVDPTYCTVKNLMTGELVKIPAVDRGGACDPSTESYWSA
jgi:hypothetical protein